MTGRFFGGAPSLKQPTSAGIDANALVSTNDAT